ncbi:hypothetical protein CRG98_035957 [Punica granatum]|uniref:Uncharacterized protein n=1 Tax=Punica granatum TaxID=22663 RepID=A0A2I0II36_PUNGR|nr:hypothetical protein CRG98_035957 [Punica granatum]
MGRMYIPTQLGIFVFFLQLKCPLNPSLSFNISSTSPNATFSFAAPPASHRLPSPPPAFRRLPLVVCCSPSPPLARWPPTSLQLLSFSYFFPLQDRF